MDSDNTAARDPTYLFETKEFKVVSHWSGLPASDWIGTHPIAGEGCDVLA